MCFEQRQVDGRISLESFTWRTWLDTWVELSAVGAMCDSVERTLGKSDYTLCVLHTGWHTRIPRSVRFNLPSMSFLRTYSAGLLCVSVRQGLYVNVCASFKKTNRARALITGRGPVHRHKRSASGLLDQPARPPAGERLNEKVSYIFALLFAFYCARY